MLKHGNIARALSWGGLAGVMTLASIVLPLAPTWGQEQPAPDNVQRRPAASAVEVAPARLPPKRRRLPRLPIHSPTVSVRRRTSLRPPSWRRLTKRSLN